MVRLLKKQPIGIFDSGVGGLTVFKEIRKKFPYEDIIYFGDTARVPYGPKSPATVIQYSIQNARFLMQCGAKIIVVACNTSSSVALDELTRILPIPVIGVIIPGAEAAAKSTTSGNIGIIGTEGTIRSNAYAFAIKELNAAYQVFSIACPLFVSLTEEGLEDHKITRLVIEEYLHPFLKSKIDTLVLGCTHYPILKQAIRNFLGDQIKLVDSAEAVSRRLTAILPEPELESKGKNEFYVSDNEDKFKKIAERILETKVDNLVKVKLGESWYI